MPESLGDVVKRYLDARGGASAIEVVEERAIVGGRRYWRARVVVEGLDVATCDRLRRYLARRLKAKARSMYIVSSKVNSCWIEVTR